MPNIGFTAIATAALIMGAPCADAGFKTPESAVRNLYAYYGNGVAEFSNGLPRNEDTARQFFDSGLVRAWLSAPSPPYDFFAQSPSWQLGAVSLQIIRKQFDRTYVSANFSNKGKPVSLNFILVNSPDGYVIYDVESAHDSLRSFLQQYRK